MKVGLNILNNFYNNFEYTDEKLLEYSFSHLIKIVNEIERKKVYLKKNSNISFY